MKRGPAEARLWHQASHAGVDAIAAFRVKGVAGVSPQQEADLRRPIPLA